MRSFLRQYEPKRLNVFSYAMYFTCVWLLHLAYMAMSRFLPGRLSEKGEELVNTLTSQEAEKNIFTDSEKSLQVAWMVRCIIMVMDFTILVGIVTMIPVILYALVKMGAI